MQDLVTATDRALEKEMSGNKLTRQERQELFGDGFSDLYVADPRFTRTYEDIAPGLAQYVRDAIHANADRAAGAAGTLT